MRDFEKERERDDKLKVADAEIEVIRDDIVRTVEEMVVNTTSTCTLADSEVGKLLILGTRLRAARMARRVIMEERF